MFAAQPLMSGVTPEAAAGQRGRRADGKQLTDHPAALANSGTKSGAQMVPTPEARS
jgi:hypothetical protein